VLLKEGEGLFGSSVAGGDLVIPMTAGGESAPSCPRTHKLNTRLPLYRECQRHSRTAGRVEERYTGIKGGEWSFSVLMSCMTKLRCSTPRWPLECFAW
jgi:hypothetical protein